MNKEVKKLGSIKPNDTFILVKDISLDDFESENTNIDHIDNNVYCLYISKDINDRIDYYYLTIDKNKNITRINSDLLSTNKPLMSELIEIRNKTNRGKILPMGEMTIGEDLMDLCNGTDLGYFPETISNSKYKLLETWFPDVLDVIKNVKIVEDNQNYQEDSIHYQCNR